MVTAPVRVFVGRFGLFRIGISYFLARWNNHYFPTYMVISKPKKKLTPETMGFQHFLPSGSPYMIHTILRIFFTSITMIQWFFFIITTSQYVVYFFSIQLYSTNRHRIMLSLFIIYSRHRIMLSLYLNNNHQIIIL